MSTLLNDIINQKAKELLPMHSYIIIEHPDSPLNVSTVKNSLARALLASVAQSNYAEVEQLTSAFLKNFKVQLNLADHFRLTYNPVIDGTATPIDQTTATRITAEKITDPLFQIAPAPLDDNDTLKAILTVNMLKENKENLPTLTFILRNIHGLSSHYNTYQRIQFIVDKTSLPKVIQAAEIAPLLTAQTIHSLLDNNYELSLADCLPCDLARWGLYAEYQKRISSLQPSEINYLADLNLFLATMDNAKDFSTEFALIDFLLDQVIKSRCTLTNEELGSIKFTCTNIFLAKNTDADFERVIKACSLESALAKPPSKSQTEQYIYHFTATLSENSHETHPIPYEKMSAYFIQRFQSARHYNERILLKVLVKFKEFNLPAADKEQQKMALTILLQKNIITHQHIQAFILKCMKKKHGLSQIKKLISLLKKVSYDFTTYHEGMSLLETCFSTIAAAPENAYPAGMATFLFKSLKHSILPMHTFLFNNQQHTVLQLINENPNLAGARNAMLHVEEFRQIVNQLAQNRARIVARVQGNAPHRMIDNTQSTHAKAVHKSVSESAVRLLKRYYPGKEPHQLLNNELVATIQQGLFIPLNNEVKEEFRLRLEKKYAHLLREEAEFVIQERMTDFNNFKLAGITRNGFENIANCSPFIALSFLYLYVSRYGNYIDPASKISLCLAFALLSKALNDDTIFNAEDRKREIKLLAGRLMQLNSEYGEGHPSCESGVFNIIEFLDKKHPDVEIIRISGENLEDYIRDYMQEQFAQLKPLAKDQLAALAQKNKCLPEEFVAAHREGFYRAIAKPIAGEYIDKELVDAWFDAMTGENAIHRFPEIANYVPQAAHALGVFGETALPPTTQNQTPKEEEPLTYRYTD